MDIEPAPTSAAVRRILRAAELPTSDIDGLDLDLFLAAGNRDNPSGIIGLEPLGAVGLLRSLAVIPAARGTGLGGQLVRALEALARVQGVQGLFLLTTTAEPFFAAQGYAVIERGVVPRPIRESREFSSLCPDSATVMTKRL
ncbi:MAG: arsenic resistance N-acetyltransferase ArsN2 [Pseudomonadota bacterium]